MPELYNLIVRDVYTNAHLQSDVNNFRPKIEWVMDFKGVALQATFLKLFCEQFYNQVLKDNTLVIQVAGMESGALPLLAALVLTYPERIKSSFYFRKSRKKHDLVKQIEGEYNPHLPVILVDDVLNSASTMQKQIAILESLGTKPAGVFSVIRFRDVAYYAHIFGPDITVYSLFELNDFSRDLPIKNLEFEKQVKSEMFNRYKPVWKVTFGPANHYDVLPKSAPALVKDRIFMGTDQGALMCLESGSGDKIWEYKTQFTAMSKGIYSSPVVFEDCVYFGAYDGNVYCLDVATGKSNWVCFEGDYVGSSPCVAPDLGLVFVGLEFGLFKKRGGVIALEAKSGKVAWVDRDISDFVHASPAYSQKFRLVVCGSNNGTFYAFDAKSGKRKWEFKTGGDIRYKAAFDEERGLVLVGSLDGTLYALNIADGSLYHEFKARSGFYSTPVMYENLVIIGSLDKVIYAFDVVAQQKVWSFETGGRIFASGLVQNRALYIGSNDGVVYELNAKTGECVGKLQLTERIVNQILATDTALYIPTHANELCRYDKIEKLD